MFEDFGNLHKIFAFAWSSIYVDFLMCRSFENSTELRVESFLIVHTAVNIGQSQSILVTGEGTQSV